MLSSRKNSHSFFAKLYLRLNFWNFVLNGTKYFTVGATILKFQIKFCLTVLSYFARLYLKSCLISVLIFRHLYYPPTLCVGVTKSLIGTKIMQRIEILVLDIYIIHEFSVFAELSRQRILHEERVGDRAEVEHFERPFDYIEWVKWAKAYMWNCFE